MMGIPIDGPVNVFCDNNSVVTNSTIPTSTLKKKHNSFAYHRVREAVAAQILQISKVYTSENLADLLTKLLSRVHLKYLIQKILVGHVSGDSCTNYQQIESVLSILI
jgi:hypothetical protein